MPKVVSNSSVLIHLAKIDSLDLLSDQFGEVLIPYAARRETVKEGGNKPDALAIAEAAWLKVREVPFSPLLATLGLTKK